MIKNLLIVLLLLIAGGLAAALLWNGSGTAPAASIGTAGAPPDDDIRLTIGEAYLTRRLEADLRSRVGSSAIQNLNIDVQPNNEIRAVGNALIFGLPVPLAVTLRLVVSGGAIRTEVISGTAGPVRLPQPVLDEVQQSVNAALSDVALFAGTGLEATGLESGDGALTVFMRERAAR